MKRFQFFLTVMLLSAALALSARDGLCSWKNSKRLVRGIEFISETVSSPRPMKINAVRIDLAREKFGFAATGRADIWGQPMPDADVIARTERQTVPDFLKNARKNNMDMILAVNANPWTPWRNPFTHRYGGNLGLVISDGVVVDTPNGTPSLLQRKDGRFEIRTVGKSENLSDYQLAVSGFAIILNDGKPKGGKDLQPRTAFGLSKDARYLYFVTVDGRMPKISEGIGTLELGDILRYFGAYTAINMDGGGSTTLIIRQNGTIRRLNAMQGFRNVAVSLGVFRK